MSRQVRHRVAAWVVGGVLLGAPLLTNGTANAEQVEAGGRQVVFAGAGMLGLACRSAPDVAALTVPAESTVRVVNRTGHSARLKLGGTVRGTVPDDGATEVVFRRGTTAVLLTPSCALGDGSTPVMVTATPSAPASTTPDPTPAPIDTDADAGPAVPSDSGSPTTAIAGPALPDSTVPAQRPQHSATSENKPARTRPQRERRTAGNPAAIVPIMPQGGAAATPAKIKSKVTRGTSGASPSFAGMPPGDQKRLLGGVPTVDLPPPAGPSPAAPALPPSGIAVAEPVASMSSITRGGEIGLLGAVAAICVIGVAIGAIRAIVSERASRAMIA